MVNQTEKEFKKYLNKICPDSLLQEYAIDYYHDLAERYKNEYFTKDNFQTLKVDGCEVEQDIVKDLFVFRDKVRAEEILLYLMKKNINSIIFFSKSKFFNELGYVDLDNKELGIKLEPLSKYYTEPEMKKTFDRDNMYNKHLTKQQKKEMKEVVRAFQQERETLRNCAIAQMKQDIKECLYHEMSHIFEIKTFDGGKYLMHSATDYIQLKGLHNKYISCDVSEIKTEEIENLKQHYEEIRVNNGTPSVEDYISAYKISGAKLLSEIFNEVFSRKVGNYFQLEFKTNQYNRENFINKAQLQGNTAYHEDYDVMQYIQLALGNFDEKNYRFNPKKMIEKLNGLNVSQKKLNAVKNKIVEFLLSESKTNKEKLLNFQLSDHIKNLDIYSTICYILGMHHNLKLIATKDATKFNYSTYNDFKTLIQEILVEAIKNNIYASFNNNTIEKDAEYFHTLNTTLQLLDDFMWYPNNDILIYEGTETTRIKAINLLSVERFVKYQKQYAHITNFKELIVKVKALVKQYEGQVDGLNNIMSFFQEQSTLEENLQEIIKTHAHTLKNNSSPKVNLNLNGKEDKRGER